MINKKNFNTFIKKVKAFKNPHSRGLLLRRLTALTHINLRKIIFPHPIEITVGKFSVGDPRHVFVIAEIGVNHNGSIRTAKKLIDAAHEAEANAVKFQKRDLAATYQKRVVTNPELYDQAFQYLIPILKECEFGEKEYRELKEYAEKKGLVFLATAFDEPSVDFLSRVIEPPAYKVASADLINIPLLERLMREKAPLILSTGMSTLDEVDTTAAFLHKNRAKFSLLHCHSAYPAASDTLNLAMIQKLKNRYGVPVGYSGHELGIHHTLQAVALGATIIERHITLDRMSKGPDHNASLEPGDFKELVSKIREYEKAYGVPVKQISRGEVANRLTLRKSIVAATDIQKGALITRSMLTAKSPGTGLSPQFIYDLVGTRAKRDFKTDDMFTNTDLHGNILPATLPYFPSKWGLKARFAEMDVLSKISPAPALFEFHASEEDLSFPFDTSKKYPQELYVHTPEYWGKDVVDLASSDNRVWEESIKIMQRTIDKTREIAKSFTGTPKIVIHVGGMSITPLSDRKKLLARSKEAFRRLDAKGVELLPENLPPFGWFFSGLWYCNIFGAAEEMIEFCRDLKLRMCFDLSHAWLYCSEANIDYCEYIKKIAPYTVHLHISDGRGSRKEGLQIGEGDVPFEKAFEILKAHGPKGVVISWVPEIWQGHVNDYQEFKIALGKLAKYRHLAESTFEA